MASLKNRPATVSISNLSPVVEDGRYPTKRVVDEALHVSADIFKDGHDVLCANLLWRKAGKKKWNEVPMTQYENDHWGASLSFDKTGPYEIKVTAWGDDFLSWIHDFERRLTGDQEDFSTEVEEGRVILGGAAIRAATGKSGDDAEAIEELTTQLMKAEPGNVPALLDSPEVLEMLARWPNLEFATILEDTLNVIVETKLSSFSAWYEFFPRSAEGIEGKHSTFRDCLPRIEDAKAMGFDVIYFPPIHPIGVSHRKGKNNSVTCEPGDVGSPWAIGAKEGGHRSVEPQLGTLDDFTWLLKKARKIGMEIALDFAI
ncbi:MAG: DUF3416 domain-containing protein, partial [Verrucomicrobiales bacterium]|nr:DUF3416 domain-containing protein [Verrucomicrobiales bacterium]